MRYFSTRGTGPVSLDDALRQGIAADGGLFLPERLPEFDVQDFRDAETIPAVATVLLRPFFEGSSLDGDLVPVLEETFSFPIPTRPLPIERHDV